MVAKRDGSLSVTLMPVRTVENVTLETVFIFSRWKRQRSEVENEVGRVLTVESLVTQMEENEENGAQ